MRRSHPRADPPGDAAGDLSPEDARPVPTHAHAKRGAAASDEVTLRPDMRLDLWLWRTRFFKSRALAAQAIADGQLRITRAGTTRRVEKAGLPLRIGDRLNLILGSRVCLIEVVGLPDRRGPASEAQRHYRSIVNSAIDSA